MMPGFVAGHHASEDCVIPLAPLLANSGVKHIQRSAVGLDADARLLSLDDGSTLNYDVLSVNSEAVQDRPKIEQMMPGAREHALFVRPIEVFGVLWPQVVALSQSRALRVAVVGGSTIGIELACAVAHRLQGASVTLLTGDAAVAADYPPAVQTRVVRALRDRHITMLRESACGVSTGEVCLGSGAHLACDVPLITVGAQAPTWLQGSGLALDEKGFIAVNRFQCSVSHAQVFAAGDVSGGPDRQPIRSDADGARAGPSLAHNLRAVLAGVQASHQAPPARAMHLLSTGDKSAIAGWGNWSGQGRWAGWLKDRIDQGPVKKYSRPAPA